MMRVSKRTRYGLRALSALAAAYGDGPLSLRAIAGEQYLPVKYLERLFVALKAAGLVRAVRGAGGGYALVRPPHEIRLLDVFEVLEGPPDPVECLQPTAVCPHEAACVTRDVWHEVSQAVSQVLADHTLADLVSQQHPCEERGTCRT
ncbi:Rrf2 family transcriptional regulator [bacterium]|nr:Rrf2 family transcriptional regulator [bacterium]